MTHTQREIMLRSSPDHALFAYEDVYFAFGDGRLEYDCRSCSAKCCRGCGYTLNSESEIATQASLKPAIIYFIGSSHNESNRQLTVGNCQPACFFLDDHGLCGIHTAHGYSSKPETCKLFPFNQIRQVGRFLVVVPHTTLCPLRVVPSGRRADASMHSKLFDNMAHDGLSIDVPAMRDILGAPDRLLGLERTILAHSETSLDTSDYLTFIRRQIQITDELQPVSWHRETFDTFCGFIRMLLGPPPERHDSELALVLMAANATLRSTLVLRHEPQRFVISVRRVPYALLVLATLAARARDAGMRSISFQTVCQLLHDHLDLIALLSYADCEMMLRPDATIDLRFGGGTPAERRYFAIVRALLPACQRRRHAVLGELLAESMVGTPLARVSFLKGVASRLGGRIMPLSRGSSGPHNRISLRTRWQHWALGCASDALLGRIAKQQISKAAGRSHSA